jgi:hypothetical protein
MEVINNNNNKYRQTEDRAQKKFQKKKKKNATLAETRHPNERAAPNAQAIPMN